MIVFDTNVWVGFLYKEDTLHTRAVDFFSNHNTWPVVLPEYILVETSTVLLQRSSKQTTKDFLAFAYNTAYCNILRFNNTELRAITTIFVAQPQKHLSFVDASLLFLGQQHTIVTFDGQLKKSLARL